MPNEEPLLIDIPKTGSPVLGVVFAHGAGIGMDHWFMNSFANALNQLGIAVARFEFPYRQTIRETGIKRPPNPMPVLVESFQAAYTSISQEYPTINWHVMGKSLGSRVAVSICATENCLKAICLGYPFHPVGKPDKLRIDLLNSVENSILVFQGTRDPFGRLDEVRQYPLNTNIEVCWLEEGDHDFVTKKSSRIQFEDHCFFIAGEIKQFLEKL